MSCENALELIPRKNRALHASQPPLVATLPSLRHRVNETFTVHCRLVQVTYKQLFTQYRIKATIGRLPKDRVSMPAACSTTSSPG